MSWYSLTPILILLEDMVTTAQQTKTHDNAHYDSTVSTYQQYKHISQFILNFLLHAGWLPLVIVNPCLSEASIRAQQSRSAI